MLEEQNEKSDTDNFLGQIDEEALKAAAEFAYKESKVDIVFLILRSLNQSWRRWDGNRMISPQTISSMIFRFLEHYS